MPRSRACRPRRGTLDGTAGSRGRRRRRACRRNRTTRRRRSSRSRADGKSIVPAMLLLIAALLTTDTTTQAIKVAVGRDESLRVVTSGAGQPVVMIPGLFGSAYSFRKRIPLLADCGYRTVIVEPLGIGFSSKPPKADYSLSPQAERVAAPLDAPGIRHAIRLGPPVVEG